MEYSEKVMDHFTNPRNVGVVEDADGVGRTGNPVCGDLMEMSIKVEEDVITDIKFRTFGCGAAIATSSMATELIKGKRVLVVEDGPTVTHGEMPYGAAAVAARKLGAELVDPRPYARGEIAEVYSKYPHLGPVLPAMGYGEKQIADLAATIAEVPCDVVAIGTPIDLRRLMALPVPATRVRYELQEIGSPTLEDVLSDFLREG